MTSTSTPIAWKSGSIARFRASKAAAFAPSPLMSAKIMPLTPDSAKIRPVSLPMPPAAYKYVRARPIDGATLPTPVMMAWPDRANGNMSGLAEWEKKLKRCGKRLQDEGVISRPRMHDASNSGV